MPAQGFIENCIAVVFAVLFLVTLLEMAAKQAK